MYRAEEPVDFTGGPDHQFHVCKQIIPKIDWEHGFKRWEEAFERSVPGSSRESMKALEGNQSWLGDPDAPTTAANVHQYPDDIKPSFRVTCNRAGQKTDFKSDEIAKVFGGAVQDTFAWNVRMKGFDFEIVINLEDNKNVDVLIALTTESLHNRNLFHFGRTALRATIAYNLVLYADPQPGDIFLDPMCGGGSIPIEAGREWPELAAVMAGELDPKALEICRMNVALNPASRVELFNWDSTRLPMPTDSVDVIVTDMPFGKRIGKRADNRWLYPRLIKEWARVSRLRSGRAVLLSNDQKTLNNAVDVSKYWKKKEFRHINLGGLNPMILLITRNDVEYTE